MIFFHRAGTRPLGGLAGCIAAALVLATMFVTASLAEARPKFAAVAVDARSGKVLFGSDIDGLRHPASLTKMMTLYVVFQELKAGRIKLSTPLLVSRRAANMPPSKLGLKPGSRITVDDAIRALVTKSANDVAATIGENLGGSEANFAARLTRTARSIGMTRSTFRNASGLPNPDQWTTARDMATLGLRLQRDFPQYYPYFRITSFNYKGRVIRTHNRLLGRFAGTDGIKTGYINASGFNLTTSAKRGDRRIVGVVLGARTGASRNAYMMSMLSSWFPKCAPGNTIAAKAGSSAGAINPLAPVRAVVDRKRAKAEEQKEASASANDNASAATALSAVTADPEPPAGADETRVLEAKMAEASEGGEVYGDGGTDEDEAAAAGDTAAESETANQIQSPTGPLPFKVKQPGTDGGQLVSGVPAPTSWAIQVGAFPSRENAERRLSELQAKGYNFLKGKSPVTIESTSGDDRIYRARFIGFSQKSAKAACSQLVQRGLKCLAMAPQAQS